MNVKELQQFVENLSNEKGIHQQEVVEALENAIASAYRKQLPEDPFLEVRIELDFAANSLRAFKVWVPQSARVNADGEEVDFDAVDPSLLEEEEIPEFRNSRIAAQAARQIITQRIREARREQLALDFSKRIGELFYGTIKRATREMLLVEIEPNLDAILPRDHLLPREATRLRVGDKVRAVLADVRVSGRGNQLILSRTDQRMLRALFSQEIPEIKEDIIEIRAIARDPGARAKVAVKTNDRRIDPIGACIGLRGSRVQLVSDELGGEKIDVIEWSDNPSDLIINAFHPLKMISIVVDDDKHSIDVAIDANDLAQAIGRNGQSIKLVNELSGWRVHVMSEEDMSAKYHDDSERELQKLMTDLDIDEDLATRLLNQGYASVDHLLSAQLEELATIEGFSMELAEELQSRATDAQLRAALSGQTEPQKEAEPQLRELPSMNARLLDTLIAKEIYTRDDLGELATDELCDLIGIGEDEAAKLILEARAHWFAEENTEQTNNEQ